MIVLFDIQDQPLNELRYALFGLAPLALMASKSARRHWRWLVGLGLFIAVLAAGIPLWDHMRLRKLEGVQTTRGPLTETWRVNSVARDFTKDRLAYKRWTTEGFKVGGEGFRYVMGRGLSGAAFTNFGKIDLKPYEGRMAEVRWFTDPASQNERRILRLAVAEAGQAPAGPAAPAAVRDTQDFSQFWEAFSKAALEGDAAAIRGMTGFPFMLGGNDVTADQFSTLWAGLFTPSMRACLAKAKPIADQEVMQAFCEGTIFIFARDQAGWRFTEIGADD